VVQNLDGKAVVSAIDPEKATLEVDNRKTILSPARQDAKFVE
jgi:hypothetical protein